MKKFHFNQKTGKVGECTAGIQCPFGSKESHYDTPNAARKAYENIMGSLVDYQNSYEGYNQPLREGKPIGSVKGAIKIASFVWSNGPQREHDFLFRGIDPWGGEWAQGLTPGQEITDLGFFSTSSSYDVAAWFATGEGSECGTVVKILNSQDFPAAAMPSYPSKQMQEFGIEGEDEYLLPPGLVYRIERVGTCEWDGEEYRMAEVTVLPPPSDCSFTKG